jgi:hypothetical protein
VVTVGRAWALSVLRGAYEQPGVASVSLCGEPPLASHAVTSQPERPYPLGSDAASH